MDTAKFLSFLDSGCLYFCRSDKLGDPFEGSLPIPLAAYWQRIKEGKKSGEIKGYKNLTDEHLDMLATSSSVMAREARFAVFVNCWHMNEVESAAMWSLYGKTNEAVCITTTFAKLAEALPSNCNLGLVTYASYESDSPDLNGMRDAFFLKRSSFAHEREVRALFVDNEYAGESEKSIKLGINIEIDIASLVVEVLVSPASPNWYREVISNACAKYGLNRSATRSSMARDPVF